MASFSYQLHQPFSNSYLVDSTYNLQMPSSSQVRMSEDPNLNNLRQFYQQQLDSSLEQIPIAKSSFNGSCNNDSSSVLTDKLESGEEQVTQNVPAAAINNKRKSKQGLSLNNNSAQSTKGRGEKKQRKFRGNTKNEEEKKAKEDNKKQKKVDEEAPIGYIHVRARRGQATDSHSLAERVRREKISERMKILQALVPGCDKVTGKALMLDEIINYVQSLQNQVEFLSVKLASLNPLFYDYGMDLDCLMARPDQILSNMASPEQNPQQCEEIEAPIISDKGTTLRTDSATNSFSQLDTSASAVFFPQSAHHQHHIPQIVSQANGQLLWDVDEQRQKLINNQTGLTTNLCSFH